jgi:hypothetical protein
LFWIPENKSDFESWVLAEFKKNNFIKIGGTKKIHGPNALSTSHIHYLSTNFFFKVKIYLKLEIFGKPASETFRKVMYVPTNDLELRSYSSKST